MVFVMVFMIIGIALYFLIASQTRATETERTDVKSFNVSEAGIDAGMLRLKLAWPRTEDDGPATVDNNLLVTSLRAINSGLYLPNGEDDEERIDKFLQVQLYDNVDQATGLTTTVAGLCDPDLKWDSNGDGKMFVDATANVDNDRHRILVLAERQKWDFNFPATLALWAGVVDSNGQGLEISIEDGTPPVYYDVHDAQHKGVDPQPPTDVIPSNPTSFDQVCSEAQRRGLEKAAIDRNTYFDGPTAAADASAFLATPEAGGSVVYVKSDTAVTISGNTQIGTEDEPVVLIIDTPDGAENVWDLRGTGDFWGIIITIGDSTLRGTSGIHGAMYVSGTLKNDGNGSSGEINYNAKCISNVNRQYVISVNLVPNTWEEYTLPAG
jgi:hypothetical protein